MKVMTTFGKQRRLKSLKLHNEGRTSAISHSRNLHGLFSFEEPTPPPPSLPLMEWRGIKPHPYVSLKKEDARLEALTNALNTTPIVPTIPQQPKPARTKLDHFVAKDDLMLSRKKDF